MSAAPGPVLGSPVVFFTGAGISVGAGLPTYRGTGGLYEGTGLEPPRASDVAPGRLPGLWARFADRLRSAEEIRPSAAHRAIADYESRTGSAVTVVTQNVDGLHLDAGSTDVVELHGTLRSVRCLPTGHVSALADAEWADDGIPRCPSCGDVTRPGVVLFGETLPEGAWAAASAAIARASSIISVGTSAQVQPAAGLIRQDRLRATTRVWVNPETEPPDAGWTWLRGAADDEVVALLSR